jgi:hypothetical protein
MNEGTLYTLIIVAMAEDAINPELEATSLVLWYGLAQDAGIVYG